VGRRYVVTGVFLEFLLGTGFSCRRAEQLGIRQREGGNMTLFTFIKGGLRSVKRWKGTELVVKGKKRPWCA